MYTGTLIAEITGVEDSLRIGVLISSAAALKGRFFQPFLYTERSKMHQLKPVGFTKDGVPIYTDTPNPPYVKLTKDDIKRRQRIIDEAMKKREKDHEEYMR